MARRDLVREIAGLVSMGWGIFLFLCLYSFHPQDPSFNLYHPLSPQIHNLGGVIGAYLSDILWQSFGCASLLLPLIFFVLGICLFFGWMIESKWLRLGGSVLLLISLSALLDLLLGEVKVFSFEGMAGGVLGGVLGTLLKKYLSVVGAFFLVTLWFISSAMLTTGISLKKGLVGLGRMVGNVLHWVVKIKDLRKGRLEKRRKSKIARIKEVSSPPIIRTPKGQKEIGPRQETFPFPESAEGGYHLPSLALLDGGKGREVTVTEDILWANSQILERKLKDYGVEGKVVGVRPGPIVAVYEFEPAPGVKVNRILNLEDDLALALSALSIRIEAPIPGKPVVGIEIPNPVREDVYLKDVVRSELFQGAKSKLTLAMGKDISGNPFVIDLARLPHLLVAGSTGSGKSVSINCMISGILLKATPDEVKFLLIDPKMLELSSYEGIPHLLLPVVIDPKEAAIALRWVVEEMERRYSMMAEKGFRNIEKYNQRVKEEESLPPVDLAEGATLQKKLPYVVVVIDELADLMIVSGRDVEESTIRLAQMARAAGIHLILATQRPSVDVLTGLIKVNVPARISFQVSTKVDSRTILDAHGAEHLLGSGDMLFLPPGSSKFHRIHGAHISEGEIKRLTEFWRRQGSPSYDRNILRERRERKSAEDEEHDEKYDDAVAFVAQTGQASISLIQRKFRIGYNRAARIIERMEQERIVGHSDGVKPREVLIHKI